MNNRFVFAALAASLLGMTACSKPPASDIGLVDVARLTSNWPKFLNYQNQLNADMAAIKNSNAPDSQKQREMQGLQYRFQTNQTELTNNVRDAANQVASDKHLRMVFTRQFVGYGGVDITPDVEKILQIVEKATPSP
ncbi:MAG TPA: OmpH family outer membrane protein [Candidatus Lustribacter sp.]|jgi:Skp family chaperone for outer membrane proteins|nr:OmpH family outer membrane protein [Candidatus Lustribacter sp.]